MSFKDVKQEKYVFTHCELLFHNMFAFAQNVCWSLILPVVIPRQTIELVGRARKATVMGFFLALINIAHLFAAALFGIASDWTGKRKFFVIMSAFGTALFVNLFCWVPLWEDGNFYLKIALYGMLLFFSAIFGMGAAGPYLAIIPDKMHREQYGTASGWNGALVLAGNVAGGCLALLFDYVPFYATQLLISVVGLTWIIGLLCLAIIWRNREMDIIVHHESKFNPKDERKKN